ncbi:MAG: twin-arginine translocase subunit TatC [Anaerolineaceae bacterium]|nr:twin-arginine translocase subunit TatC [Anaerolineaceae bacterium]
MSLGEHLEDLRRRVLLALAGPLVGFVVCYVFFRNHLLYAILNPRFPTFLPVKPVERAFNMANPYDVFITMMFTSLIVGCIATSPWSIYHIWSFISGGLYPKERRYVRSFGGFSVVLFLSGAAFFYFLVYPMTVSFLYGFAAEYNAFIARTAGQGATINPDTLLGGYVNFVLLLTLVFGVMFQLPLVVLFLGKIGLADVGTFRHYRRHVLLGLVALAALVTPPDVFSQVALALPMWLLYEIGVLILWISERRKQRADAEQS